VEHLITIAIVAVIFGPLQAAATIIGALALSALLERHSKSKP
jgi:hypothetical protein